MRLLTHLLALAALAIPAYSQNYPFVVKNFAGSFPLGDGGPAANALLYFPSATVPDPASGRTMQCLSTEPGVQLYPPVNTRRPTTGPADAGEPPLKYAAFCLETQHYPDSPNRPDFPNVILKPGETFRSTTVYRLSIAP